MYIIHVRLTRIYLLSCLSFSAIVKRTITKIGYSIYLYMIILFYFINALLDGFCLLLLINGLFIVLSHLLAGVSLSFCEALH